MDRRGFLKGTFGGIIAGGALIQATDSDIAVFANGLQPGAPVASASCPLGFSDEPHLEVGQILYDHRGLAMAVVREIKSRRERMHIGGASDSYSNFVPGITYVDIIAVPYWPDKVRF